jgi:2-polyprenyl-3-methyl-5-hydroxy-6-metoxy-1,4-benzoquinol methylase
MSECRLCGGEAVRAFTTRDRNQAITDARFDYDRCTSCATQFLAEVPPDLGRYYHDGYYLFPSREEFAAEAQVDVHRVELLQRYVAGGRLIEVGAGRGFFSHCAREAGFNVTAIEMSGACCEHLREVVGVQALQSDTPQETLRWLEPARAITIWHVLEHVPDPWAVLEAAVERLEPGGALIVAMPNPDSVQFRVLRGRWVHVDAPRHLQLIPYATLRERLEQLGMRAELLTTDDLDSRACTRFGWECAVRRFPASRQLTLRAKIAAEAIGAALRPFERRGLGGAAYTALFVKPRTGRFHDDRAAGRRSAVRA